jgi:hypothetical protein
LAQVVLYRRCMLQILATTLTILSFPHHLSICLSSFGFPHFFQANARIMQKYIARTTKFVLWYLILWILNMELDLFHLSFQVPRIFHIQNWKPIPFEVIVM